jgi:hypothetical protein
MPAPEGSLKMTGRAEFREHWGGGLVLYLEEKHGLYDPAMGPQTLVWRRAKQRDLSSLRYKREKEGLEPLI